MKKLQALILLSLFFLSPVSLLATGNFTLYVANDTYKDIYINPLMSQNVDSFDWANKSDPHILKSDDEKNKYVKLVTWTVQSIDSDSIIYFDVSAKNDDSEDIMLKFRWENDTKGYSVIAPDSGEYSISIAKCSIYTEGSTPSIDPSDAKICSASTDRFNTDGVVNQASPNNNYIWIAIDDPKGLSKPKKNNKD